MSACSPARDHGPAPGPGTQMGTVSITDNGDMVYRDADLERLLVEAEEQELYCLQYMVATASSMCREMPDLASLGSGQEVCALCTSRGVQHR